MTTMMIFPQNDKECCPIRVNLDQNIEPGPMNHKFKVVLEGDLIEKENNEYTFSKPSRRSDAIHTFTASQMVYNLFKKVDSLENWKLTHIEPYGLEYFQSTDTEALNIAHAGFDAQSATSEYRLIWFHFSHSKGIYTCRSFDLVTHEAAHAVLHTLNKSLYTDNTNKELIDLLEGFPDIASFLVIFSNPALSIPLINHAEGMLLEKNRIESWYELGRTFSEKSNPSRKIIGMRNALNRKPYIPNAGEDHNIQVLSGLIYKVLIDNLPQRDKKVIPDTDAILKTTTSLTALVVRVIKDLSPIGHTVSRFAKSLLKNSAGTQFQSSIETETTRRNFNTDQGE